MALALTATPDVTTVPPSVTITISGATGPTTLTRQAADGTAGTVRTSDGGPVPTSQTVVRDYEAPLGQPLTYIANSGETFSDPVTLSVDQVWLVHPGRPELSVPVTVASLDTRQRPARQGVFQVIGRERPIVVSDSRRGGVSGSLSLLTQSLLEIRALLAVLADSSTLLLNVPASKGWGLTTEYIAVGDVDEARPARVAAAVERLWTLPFIVVDAPLGGSSSGPVDPGGGGTPGTRTWASLALEADTWAEAAALYPTWADAAAG